MPLASVRGGKVVCVCMCVCVCVCVCFVHVHHVADGEPACESMSENGYAWEGKERDKRRLRPEVRVGGEQ